MTGAPDNTLAATFAGIARRLHEDDLPEKVLDRITRAAVDTVDGCVHAAISVIRRRGGIETVAATDDVPPAVDAIQYEVGQGPCLEAIEEHETFLIDDLATDDRWPLFARRAAHETGVRSMLVFRLFVESDTIGALNLYAREVGAFDANARAVGTILATHAALGVRAARDRQRAEQLDHALESNREIGMAMGVLMAQGGISREEAFAVLQRASQHLNRRLRDVAVQVVDTGVVPERTNPRGRN